ncbi:MAG: HpcH/HpaI aldolase family protein [Desertimonas sp.]
MTGLRERWAAGGSTLGAWLSIPSVLAAETTARTGFDYVCADLQHGALDYADAVGLFQAIAVAGGTPVVRVPWNEPGVVGKVLDAGAQGVIAPMVNSAAEAEALVQASRYPPHGARSFGPILAAMRADRYAATANDTIAVVPMIETAEAVGNLDDILSVPGVDAVYVGPADLSLSLGLPPGNNDDVPAFTEALQTIVAACARHGVVPGIHSSGGLTPRRLEQGFRMITVTADAVAMRLGLSAELEAARSTDAGAPGELY